MSFFEGTRRNILKACQWRFRLDFGKHFFTERAVKDWNRLPRAVVQSPFLEGLSRGGDVTPGDVG